MSTLNAPRNVSTRSEERQDQVVTFYAKAWGWVDQNRGTVYGMLALLVIAAVALAGWTYYQSQQAAEAEDELADIVRVYEAGRFEQALDGTETSTGLVSIAEEYGSTPAGNLAAFYAADAFYQLGRTEEALEYFEAYDREENFLGASALAGQAAANEDLGNFGEAASLYEEAAEFYPNEATSPQYLLDAGRNYEQAGELADARAMYEQLETEYPESAQAQEVDFYLARVEARSAE